MTEQTENATRLARPLIRLAKLAGIATSYVGMSRDYHEIEDDVLVAVLKALGIDASNDDAIEQSITTIQRERNTRIVPPTVLHIVGKKSKVEVHGGALDVPAASITLEDGETYAGKIEHEGGSGAAVDLCARRTWCFRKIFPKGITPLKSPWVARRSLQPLSVLRRRSNCLTR